MSIALDTYLKAHDISDPEFATLIDRDRSTVSRLRRGVVQPTIALANVIEKVTDGAVSIRSWIDDRAGRDAFEQGDHPLRADASPVSTSDEEGGGTCAAACPAPPDAEAA